MWNKYKLQNKQKLWQYKVTSKQEAYTTHYMFEQLILRQYWLTLLQRDSSSLYISVTLQACTPCLLFMQVYIKFPSWFAIWP